MKRIPIHSFLLMNKHIIFVTVLLLFVSCNKSSADDEPKDLSKSYLLAINYIHNISNENISEEQKESMHKFKYLLKQYSPRKLDTLKNYLRLYVNYETSLIRDDNTALDEYIKSKKYKLIKSDNTIILEKKLKSLYYTDDIEATIIALKPTTIEEAKEEFDETTLHKIKLIKEINDMVIEQYMENYQKLFDEKI